MLKKNCEIYIIKFYDLLAAIYSLPLLIATLISASCVPAHSENKHLITNHNI